jgi:DNA-binding PadR family transcriptional regulator
MSHGPRPDLTISIERPGSRRMRGLDGPGDRRGHGRHRERGEHPRPGPGRLQSRRGAIRDATLALLAEQPMHGYQVMQELAERSGGRWHPSAGSVYPTLQQLEDEGLVTVEDRDGRRTFALTDAGRTAATAIPAERPWSRSGGGDDLRGLVQELGVAALQVSRVGSPTARSEARTVLTEARRALYRLLAEDDPGSTEA